MGLGGGMPLLHQYTPMCGTRESNSDGLFGRQESWPLDQYHKLLVKGSNLSLRVQSAASVPSGPTSNSTPDRSRTCHPTFGGSEPGPPAKVKHEPRLETRPTRRRIPPILGVKAVVLHL